MHNLLSSVGEYWFRGSFFSVSGDDGGVFNFVFILLNFLGRAAPPVGANCLLETTTWFGLASGGPAAGPNSLLVAGAASRGAAANVKPRR